MGDRDGKVEPLNINTIQGRTAPRFDAETFELTPQHVTITERGMSSGYPLVDFVFESAADGKRHAFTTSGRMVLMVAAAVQAAIIRQGFEPDYVPALLHALERKKIKLEAVADAVWLAAKEGKQEFRDAFRAVILDLATAERVESGS